MSSQLQDQFEIQQLLYRYAEAADSRNADAYCACFKDGQVQLTGAYTLNDGHEVVRMLGQTFSWTMHNVHNHVHQIESDQARGYTYCVASHVTELNGQKSRLDMYIRYDDLLQRTAQGWVFVSRNLTVGSQHEVVLAS